jgi:hypothetical protein
MRTTAMVLHYFMTHYTGMFVVEHSALKSQLLGLGMQINHKKAGAKAGLGSKSLHQ